MDIDLRPLARAAHDVGLALWFGGHAMGALALNAATREVDDPEQRTRVANAGWFRWAPVVGSAMVLHLVGGVTLSRHARPQLRALREERIVAWTRTAVTVAAVAVTAESGRAGQQVVRGGDVPVATAVIPIAATPEEVARAQDRLRLVQWLVPGLTGAIWLLNAFQDERGHRRRLLAGIR